MIVTVVALVFSGIAVVLSLQTRQYRVRAEAAADRAERAAAQAKAASQRASGASRRANL